ncbi:MAG TPA: lysylphosphatidylglycerol synthase transmembrane domain-containing protein [Actinomycetota bacterium]|nr:lysylphosphatidylglycerol synthase transmembrane domain-containing protein [Actinomycetota bacterium]
MADLTLEDGDRPAPVRKRGGAIKILIRIVVGAGVFGFLIWRSDVGELWATLREARVAYLLAALGAIFAGLFVSAFRWKAYLDALEIPLSYSTLFRLYFVGTFFNAFLPTGIGGDAYKAVRLGRGKESLAPAFASVFLDRFAGVVGMAAIGIVSSSYLLASGDERRRVPLIALAASIAIMGTAATLLLGGERLLGRGRLIKREGIGGRIRRAMQQIHAAGRHPDAAARGYLFGVVFQGLVFTYHVMIAKALGIQGVPIAAIASIVVISSLATMIPLSINGLGFREGAYIWALGRYGVPHDTALAFALLVLAALLLASIVGGVIYVALGGEVHGQGSGPATLESAPSGSPGGE